MIREEPLFQRTFAARNKHMRLHLPEPRHTAAARSPGPSRSACRGIPYILNTVFEWDPRKAEANAAQHGVSFDDAVTVFLDANALDGPDLQHSKAEVRFLRLGRAADGRVLMVAYTLRRSGNAETIRLISARRASRRERAAYSAKD